jgi:MFS transporter, FSR family, fosmidomycin resistance protein
MTSMTKIPSSPSDRHRLMQPDRRVLAVFALGHLSNDWAVGAIWLVAPAMAISMGLGAQEVGLLITLYGVGAALAYLPTGLLADRLSRRGGLLLATFWWVAIGHVVASWMPDYWTFALVMTIAVMGDAAWHPVATGYLVQRYPRQRAHVLGVHAMGGTIGAEVLAPLGVGAVLAVADWRVALQVSAIPALVMGIVFIWIARRLKPVEVPQQGAIDLGGLIAPWIRGDGARLTSIMSLYNMAAVAMISMMPLYLHTDLALGPMAVSVIFAGTLLAGSLSQPWFGRLSDVRGRKPVMLGVLIVASAAAIIAGTAGHAGIVVVALLIAIAVLTGVRSVFLAAAVDIAHMRASATLGMAFTVMDGIGALGALLAGFAGADDLTRAFLLGAALAMLAAVGAGFHLRAYTAASSGNPGD